MSGAQFSIDRYTQSFKNTGQKTLKLLMTFSPKGRYDNRKRVLYYMTLELPPAHLTTRTTVQWLTGGSVAD